MLRALLLSTAAVVVAGSALAADLPRKSAPVAYMPAPPVFTWTGFYVGVNAGYGWNSRDVTTAGVLAGNVANVNAGRRPSSISLDSKGFVGGGQVGYNYQIGQFVAGVEADLQYSDVKGRSSYISAVGDLSTFRYDLDYLGTVRARLGVAFDRVLVYGTGGLAYGKAQYNADFYSNAAGQPLQFQGGQSHTRVGYAVGAGIEYAIPMGGTSAVTLRGEYLYADLGKRSINVAATPIGVGAYTSEFQNRTHLLRAGVNYKF